MRAEDAQRMRFLDSLSDFLFMGYWPVERWVVVPVFSAYMLFANLTLIKLEAIQLSLKSFTALPNFFS